MTRDWSALTGCCLPIRQLILSQVGTIPSTITDACHSAEPLVLPDAPNFLLIEEG
jgi:hypothetical protein